MFDKIFTLYGDTIFMLYDIANFLFPFVAISFLFFLLICLLGKTSIHVLKRFYFIVSIIESILVLYKLLVCFLLYLTTFNNTLIIVLIGYGLLLALWILSIIRSRPIHEDTLSSSETGPNYEHEFYYRTSFNDEDIIDVEYNEVSDDKEIIDTDYKDLE